MTKRIPQPFIDTLLSRTDIIDVIGKRVALKKNGREYAACCPFHNEKTPSFTVSPKKQFYYCFGCGASGNAIGFLMNHDRLNFMEAVELLATQLGIALPVEAGDENRREKPSQNLYSLLEQVAKFYQQNLKGSPRAIDYLKARGLTGEICKRFGIGFAQDSWDALLKQFPKQQSELLQSGMLIKKDDRRSYDRFRDRIMFPIRDKRGRVIAFGGRIIDNGQPKYLNSPETALFHKGSEAYGLYEALQHNPNVNQLIVVEGYMDVVALAQYGVNNAVASLGTALTTQNIGRLFNIVGELVLCFDGDRAGRSAALRAIDNCLPILSDGRQLKILFLPDGEDPDSLVRKIGCEKFLEKVAQSQNLSSMLIEHLLKQVDLSSLDGRAKLLELAKPFVQKLQSAVYKTLLIQELARFTRVDEQRIEHMLNDSAPLQKSNQAREVKQLTLAGRAITMLLQQPGLIQYVESPGFFKGLNDPWAGMLNEVATCMKAQGVQSMGQLLSIWPDSDEANKLARLAALETMLSEEESEEEFKGILCQLGKHMREMELSQLLTKARTLGLDGLTVQEREDIREFLANPKQS